MDLSSCHEPNALNDKYFFRAETGTAKIVIYSQDLQKINEKSGRQREALSDAEIPHLFIGIHCFKFDPHIANRMVVGLIPLDASDTHVV